MHAALSRLCARLLSKLTRAAAATAVTALALLALPTAQASGPARLPTHGKGAWPKSSHCMASRHRACGPRSTSPRTSVRRFEAVLASTRVRRGLGLPTTTQLFGRSGAKAQRRADARLLTRLTTHRSSHAAAAVAASHGVSVSASGSDKLSATSDTRAESVTGRDQLKHGGQSTLRTLHIAVSAEATCPDPEDAFANHGTVPGRVRAEQRLVTIETAGHYRLQTETSLEITGTQGMEGNVDHDAELDGVSPADRFGPEMDLVFRRTRRLTDLRSHRVRRDAPLEAKFQIEGISQAALALGSGSELEQWANGPHDDGPAADRMVSDQLMNYHSIWVAGAAFLTMVGERARAVFDRAAKYWQTPNRCVKVVDDVPERMRPDERVTIRPQARSTRGYATAAFGTWGSWGPFPSAGLKVSPYEYRRGDADASALFTVHAPAHDWPDSKPLKLRLLWRSKAGVAEVKHTIREAPKTIYLLVKSVSGSYDARWQWTDPKNQQCAYSDHEQYSLSPNPSGRTGATDGSIDPSGSLGLVIVPFAMKGTSDGTIDCPRSTIDDRTCHRQTDDQGSFYVNISHTAGSATAAVQLMSIGPPLGGCWQDVKDPGDTTTYTHRFIDLTVPWADFTRSAPFTVSGSATFTDDPDHVIKRSQSVVLQPVDANGRPLG